METRRLLTVSEVGAELRLGRNATYRLLQRCELGAIRLGTGPKAPIRIRGEELERFLGQGPRRQKDGGEAA